MKRSEITLEDIFLYECGMYKNENGELMKMDAKIRKIEKENKKEGKDLKKLEKMDKKRDKVCEMGEKMMKKKKK